MKQRYEKYTALLFGEGGKEKRYFTLFESSKKFKDKFPNWSVTFDNASGESCQVVLEKCINHVKTNRSYDLVICFIDLDKLYSDFADKHEEKKVELENIAEQNGIRIIWQADCHEDELSRAAEKEIVKARLKQELKKHGAKIINSGFTKKILALFEEKTRLLRGD